MNSTCLTETNLEGMTLLKRGKVRDVYDLGDTLLIVATDRISAFDWVLPTPIPGKGAVLCTLSSFWFRFSRFIAPNHMLETNIKRMPEQLKKFRDVISGRSMFVKKAKVFPVECVVRGYLAGSAQEEYEKNRTVCSIPLPAGLKKASKLPEPIFTPATKAEQGHDENISFEKMCDIIGTEEASALKEKSLELYVRASNFAYSRGVIIADTKFEWGVIDGEVSLIDEVLTPDSSRFWKASLWKEGETPFQYDKQIVRDWLLSTDWDKNSHPPSLPLHVVEETAGRYREIQKMLINGDTQLD
ncbi:MAG: phosphoribosylaminoimidazolesuccinocarboxamide synthase [Planctomycetota bacterium]